MIRVLWVIRAFVSGVIVALTGIAFIPREAACWLIPLQKFLTREIERRRAGQ